MKAKRKKLSLAAKLNLLTISLILLTASGIAAFVVKQIKVDNYQRLIEQGSKLASMLGSSSEHTIYGDDKSAFENLIKGITTNKDVIYIELLNHDKHLLFSKILTAEWDSSFLSHENYRYENTANVTYTEFSQWEGSDFIHLSKPIWQSEIDHSTANQTAVNIDDPIGYVGILLSKKHMTQIVANSIQAISWVALVVVITGILSTLLLTRKITYPIKVLAKAVHDIAEGQFNISVDINTTGEINELVNGFNYMVQRLQTYRDEAAEAQYSLEQKVIERTQKLTTAMEKAKQSSQTKSEFLATMSHEIRTPMNGILGMLAILQETPLNEKQQYCTQIVQNSANALLNVINDILDFSKIEAGKIELENKIFNLRHLVEEVASMFAGAAQQKKIAIFAMVPIDCWIDLSGDEMRIKQVLTNLVGNAIKFTNTGEIFICADSVEKTANINLVRFEVRDTGTGIALDHQQKIFESFSQADGSTTRKFGGTGLGLSISKKLVELMGGTIGVDSQLNEGSVFWFKLPIQQNDADKDQSSTLESVVFDCRALIVSHYFSCRDIIKNYCSHWHIPCDDEPDGHQALQHLHHALDQNRPYDIVIIDKQLADMSGKHLLEAIEQEQRLKDIGIMLLNALGEDDVQENRFQNDSASRRVSLTKPIKQSDLYSAINTLLQQTRTATTDLTNQSSNYMTLEPVIDTHEVSLKQNYRRDANILIVEDNEVNQLVVQEILTTLGLVFSLAEDGLQAIDKVNQQNFDIILMDCQMPEMDGFEATQHIRQYEQVLNNSAQSIPIIAVTANAIRGDREKCLAAGMNDYISKPFTRQQLVDVFVRWIPIPSNQTDHQANDKMGDISVTPSDRLGLTHSTEDTLLDESIDTASALINYAMIDNLRALERAGRTGVVERVIHLFLEKSPQLLDNMEQALDSGNVELMRRSAHSLKASSANLGATTLSEHCKLIEDQIRENTLQDAAAAIASLKTAYASAYVALEHELNNEKMN